MTLVSWRWKTGGTLDRELRTDRSRLKAATTAAEGITVVTCSFGDFFREQSLAPVYFKKMGAGVWL